MSVELWLVAFLTGLLAQFVDVMTGMGFGVITSSLMLAAGFPPVAVVATVNALKVGNGLMAGLAHWGFGNVRRDWMIPLSVSGVVGAFAGATLIGRLPEDTVRLWVSAILLSLGGLLLFRSLFLARRPIPRASSRASSHMSDDPGEEGSRRSVRSLIGIGLLAGFLNAISGAYGPVVTTLLMLARGGTPRYAIGTVSLVELFVAGASALGVLRALGSYDLPLGLPIAVMSGGILAAPCGAYLCRRLPARALEGVVGVTVVCVNVWSVLRAVG